MWKRVHMLTAGCLVTFSMAGMAAEAWKPVDQPDLKAKLEAAPALTPEKLGVPITSVNNWTWALVPNPDGKTYDVLQWYWRSYGGPTRLYIADLATGEVKKAAIPDRRQIHMHGSTQGPDGKHYMATGGPEGMELYVYDPAKNELENRGTIVPQLGGERRPMAWAPDGRIYGAGSYRDGTVGAYQIDPATGKVRDYGRLGPAHRGGSWGYYMAADATHVYVASGKVPWYCIAVNNQTGEHQVILDTTELTGSGNVDLSVADVPGGARARITATGAGVRKEYWLYEGKAIARTDDKPPWPARPDYKPALPPRPEIHRGQLLPDENGRGVLWYRTPEAKAAAPKEAPPGAKPEDLGWKSITFENIETYPIEIHRLVGLKDGRLYGAVANYEGNFLYDPATAKFTALGKGGGSQYGYAEQEGILYWSGYASGPVYRFDPNKPWTMEQPHLPGQSVPAAESPESNPRMLGALFDATRVKKMFMGAVGADGKIYFGGRGIRDYSGGSLGWVDPKTGKLDGFWKPFAGHRVHCLIAAMDGRLLVLSTRAASNELKGQAEEKEGKIFIFDVEKGELVRDFAPVPGAKKAGPVIEAAPGLVLGATDDPEVEGGGVVYGADIRTGEVLWRKKVPVAFNFTWSEGVSKREMVKGPDGCAWTFLGDVLVRIHPEDARIEPLGKVAQMGRFAFVGDDLYLTGTTELRRLKGIVKR